MTMPHRPGTGPWRCGAPVAYLAGGPAVKGSAEGRLLVALVGAVRRAIAELVLRRALSASRALDLQAQPHKGHNVTVSLSLCHYSHGM